ncbi:NUDIX hydrolase domain-like protein [Xylariales sp. AK1849]|nr:NUDIX hydrolase domain-like protein [Xylariales sp. AK1849]
MAQSSGTNVALLHIVESCDDFPFGMAADTYYSLYLPNDDQPHGYLLPSTVEKMPWTSEFSIQHELPRRVTVLDSSSGNNTSAAINEAFDKLITICIERDSFHVLCRRRSENFAIVGGRYDAPIFVQRFATALFGLTTRGAHLVAYTRAPGEMDMKIWIARRSAHLYTYPDMLDVTVGGGIKSGVSASETIIEEAAEEASLPAALIRQRMRSRGAISHMGLTGRGFPGEQGLVTPDYIYVYDIELPGDVIPHPHDDEVSSFELMTVDQVKAALLREDFKPDSGAVLIDFLIRHGVITPDNEKDFVEINQRLHRRLPFRTA